MKRILEFLVLMCVAVVMVSCGVQKKMVGYKADVQTFTVNGVSFNMVHVEGGSFRMGFTRDQYKSLSEEECKELKMRKKDYVQNYFKNCLPVHKVTLLDYMIGETEVTQALWTAVMGTTVADQFKKYEAVDSNAEESGFLRFEDDDYPMCYVSWNECKEFVKELSRLTGVYFRLPTEAEWEYAARGGRKSTGYTYSGSDIAVEVAWFGGNSGLAPVKTKKPNELGLYDMSGNVWEWCSDWYGDYPAGSQVNPSGPESGKNRVGRGGCWYDDAWYCSVSDRNSVFVPNFRYNCLGLRLVCVDAVRINDFLRGR